MVIPKILFFFVCLFVIFFLFFLFLLFFLFCSFQRTSSLGSKASGESIASEKSDDYRSTDTEILVDVEKEFKFPIQLEMKKCAESGHYPEENCVRRFIRDACACLQAIAGDEVTSDYMISAAKKICKELPVLKDPKPSSFPSTRTFPYWVSCSF